VKSDIICIVLFPSGLFLVLVVCTILPATGKSRKLIPN
jgi:hypothetical protein